VLWSGGKQKFTSHISFVISSKQYSYLDAALRTKPTFKPALVPYPLSDGHVPTHQQCQVTAMHLEATRGWNAQIGIQWLDKGGRLLPWPHVVNWVDEHLIDYSYSILERKLGFTLIDNDVEMANSLMSCIEDREVGELGSEWSDVYLWRLHESWYEKLKRFSFGHDVRFSPFL